jgi:hypothetical protein
LYFLFNFDQRKYSGSSGIGCDNIGIFAAFELRN